MHARFFKKFCLQHVLFYHLMNDVFGQIVLEKRPRQAWEGHWFMHSS